MMKNTFTKVFVLGLGLGLFACTGKKVADDTIRMRLPTDPPSLDWSLATDNVSREVLTHLQDGLVEHDGNNEVVPALAESWQISKDAKVYTFKLRADAKWSDGKPVVAQDFLDGWERLLNPKTGAEYAYFLFDVVGAEDYLSGKIKDFSKVGAKALDERTLQVTLKGSAAYWIHVPAFWATFPLRKDVVAQFGDRWTDPKNIVSTGPYQLKVWEHDSKIVLEKNPSYYNAANVSIPKVEFRIVKENATAVSLFDSGAIDIVRDLPPVQVRTLANRKEFRSTPYLRGYYLGFNVKDPAVSDVRIRQAIAMSIDRSEVEKALGPMIKSTSSWIPRGMMGFSEDRGMKFDPEKAKKLWASVPNKPAKLEFWFDQKELNKIVAENVQQQLKKNLGLDVALNNQEWKVYLKTLRNKAPSIWRMGWGADYPDPDNFMNLFTCKSGNNQTRLCNSKYDNMIKQGSEILDQGKRLSLYDEAQQLLLEQETAIVPLFNEVNMHLVSPRVDNFKPNTMGEFGFKDLKLKKL